MKVVITGSCGLIGSEAVGTYCEQEHEVIGIDNNMRQQFFGPSGDTSWMKAKLVSKFKNYHHLDCDIRDRQAMLDLFQRFRPEYILHAASQPSHDWAARDPFTDFEVNASGTLNLLEGYRRSTPEGVFCFLSTNKVYGDLPNRLSLVERETRYEYDGALYGKGIDEQLSVDQCLHSLFGASKLAADVLCQEFGRYFNLKVGVFRGGCLTGSKHSGVPLHGFLSYLVDCAVNGRPYQIIGYKGKQVRDQIHSQDVVRALECFRQSPRPGEVYNLGGGFQNSSSVLEVISKLESRFGYKLITTLATEPRRGDHICYYTNMEKFFSHYPTFKLEWSLDDILEEMVRSAQGKKTKAA